ncbi:MAG: trypsin-like peptidase domain-containing protein [Oscillospiraceae bacterium]|nr:trypsin-like peptidase domain-containing protein [Oscillospiraceae bacterium]
MRSALKKSIALFAVLALLVAAAPLGYAVITFDETAAGTLSDLGLIPGGAEEWLAGGTLTREDAAVMLVRASGAAALPESVCRFSDVSPDARGYIATAVALGLCAGQPDGTFAGSRAVSCKDFSTMLLRMLGYSDARGDFAWSSAPAFAASLGIGDGDIADFTRADAAQLLYAALLTRSAGGPKLIELLCASGAVTREAVLKTPLAAYADCLKPVYTAEEIFERCSAAVLCITSYESEDELAEGRAHGTSSGFFIDSEGTALICYHQLENCRVLRAKTADGREYSVDAVLWYDSLRDLAVIKLSKTCLDGRTVRAFPFIPVGDSDALSPGLRVYTVSGPLGLWYSLSEGVISATGRLDMQDPDYPLVQFTADISSGSSGGPLITVHGEAAGVVMAYYPSGNGLYLAVPVNFATGASFFASPLTPAEVYDIEQAKNAASTIWVSDPEITLRVGETKRVTVFYDCPSTVSIAYTLDDNGIVDCNWGDFDSKFSVPISITGVSEGDTNVNVFYARDTGNPDAEATIHVTVVGE